MDDRASVVLRVFSLSSSPISPQLTSHIISPPNIPFFTPRFLFSQCFSFEALFSNTQAGDGGRHSSIPFRSSAAKSDLLDLQEHHNFRAALEDQAFKIPPVPRMRWLRQPLSRTIHVDCLHGLCRGLLPVNQSLRMYLAAQGSSIRGTVCLSMDRWTDG